MIVHVVMIKFRNGAEKGEHILKAKRMIQELEGAVPALVEMETGINFSREERAMDLVLTAKFGSREDLEAYAVHPAHLEVIRYLSGVAEYSKVVDYETV